MRQITVIDELEAAEFRVASEFRVFVYAGAANDVTVYGIPGCPVEQALETAAMLSRENELIWSVAVRASELQWSWISGMDYRKRPESPREWRRRKQMQDRYVSAKVKSDEPPVLPSGLKRVRMFPEWGVEVTSPEVVEIPIGWSASWTWVSHRAMVSENCLGIST